MPKSRFSLDITDVIPLKRGEQVDLSKLPPKPVKPKPVKPDAQ